MSLSYSYLIGDKSGAIVWNEDAWLMSNSQTSSGLCNRNKWSVLLVANDAPKHCIFCATILFLIWDGQHIIVVY